MTASVAAMIDQMLDQIAPNVSEEIHPTDHMVPKSGKLEPYLSTGRSALRNILVATAASGNTEVKKILDFGCGAGRVLRWLRAAHPEAQLFACDLNEEWLAFCGRSFGATTILSSPDLTEIKLGIDYDLIWAGSLLTHLSRNSALVALDMMADALAPGGLLVATTHGRQMLRKYLSAKATYIHDEGMSQILCQAISGGHGFASHRPGGRGGVSMTPPSWLFEWCSYEENRKVIYFHEAGWGEHQDVFAVSRKASS